MDRVCGRHSKPRSTHCELRIPSAVLKSFGLTAMTQWVRTKFTKSMNNNRTFTIPPLNSHVTLCVGYLITKLIFKKDNINIKHRSLIRSHFCIDLASVSSISVRRRLRGPFNDWWWLLLAFNGHKKGFFLDYQTVNILFAEFSMSLVRCLRQWLDKSDTGKSNVYSLRNFNQELFSEGSFCHYEWMLFF